jgi:hypothetical protein
MPLLISQVQWQRSVKKDVFPGEKGKKLSQQKNKRVIVYLGILPNSKSWLEIRQTNKKQDYNMYHVVNKVTTRILGMSENLLIIVGNTGRPFGGHGIQIDYI